jgi:hypothetical protein
LTRLAGLQHAEEQRLLNDGLGGSVVKVVNPTEIESGSESFLSEGDTSESESIDLGSLAPQY